MHCAVCTLYEYTYQNKHEYELCATCQVVDVKNHTRRRSLIDWENAMISFRSFIEKIMAIFCIQ